MQVARLKAEPRTAIGRNQVAHLRKEGWTPAVVYGDDKGPQPISISEWELEQHIKQHHKVYRLDIDGSQQDAYLQEIQFDALTDRPRHVDFKRIDLSKPIEVEVEVHLLGHPVGLGKGGVLIKDHQQVTIRCLPTAIPEEIEITITDLDLDQAVHAKDLPLPQGVELVVPPEMVICHVAKLVVAQTATPETPAAGAEGAPAGEAPKS